MELVGPVGQPSEMAGGATDPMVTLKIIALRVLTRGRQPSWVNRTRLGTRRRRSTPAATARTRS
ncbi:protein of unknown function [Modestobacter italicus]|uniref:Uncharacterized protein n=1 Tax=Modestobacter italicus (strain DSM 44449 / CECT 9708 / BC 501) TaxID=2732864 RepID=I4EX70_MODI5|nr:protein of unknown function [Modestobacter marinus]